MVPPGTTLRHHTEEDRARAISLETDAMRDFETAEQAMVWSGEAFERIQTGDRELMPPGSPAGRPGARAAPIRMRTVGSSPQRSDG